MSREQWVLDCVSRAIGPYSNLATADDLASDIILELLDSGGFNWEQDEIEKFCRKRTTAMALNCLHRKEVPECEFITRDDKGAWHSPLIDRVGFAAANQETHLYASEARGFLRAIPDRQRQALEILCDGGNPLDVAEEMGVTPWEAIVVIKEARHYIGRVDSVD